MQINCILIASSVVIRPQISIFLVLRNGVSLPILIANKIFRVTVLLIIYFCDQYVVSIFRHNRCHCSVCQQDNNQHGIQRRGQDFNK